ncbi:hypothetical protein K439DRAFT_1621175 [Ramaria rubella]|nr:hypothetical protein K439DRAFT_1621175 [Ramaria rubella]
MLVFFYTLLTFVYMPACGWGRPPKTSTAVRTSAGPGRAKPATVVDNVSGTKRHNYDGLDATNILQTKREHRAPVNPYAQDDEPTFNESFDIRNVPKLDAKMLRFEVDDDYQDDGKEAMIEDDFLLDELDDPLSTVPMNKAPAKALRSSKQAPPDPKADKVKVRYGLEMDGDLLRLKNEYARAFNKKGEDANTFIYLPNDIQAAHINCKGSKTGTGTCKKAMVGDVNQDVQFCNMLKDEAVGLTDTIKVAADELSEVLKRCKRHKEDHCHVDKQ